MDNVVHVGGQDARIQAVSGDARMRSEHGEGDQEGRQRMISSAWCEVVSPWLVFGAGVCAAITGEVIGFAVIVVIVAIRKKK